MIAVTSRGASFRALGAYLARGRSGAETERVAWTSARNLVTDDPELAAKLMRATAAENVRAERPVYHLAVSFDPADRVDRATMERVVDRILDRLGLAEHQALLVSHRDREHPHVHVLVNRVHPESLRVNRLAFDYRAIESVLRSEERALGLRLIRGKHAVVSDELGGESGRVRSPAEAIEVRTGGVERLRRRGERPFLDRVRAEVPALLEVVRSGRDWSALHQALATRGLHLEQKGQGLVIVGREIGEGGAWREVKASRVHRELSLAALERRFATPFVVARKVPERGADPSGSRSIETPPGGTRAGAVRSADEFLFRVVVRERLPDLRASRSWDDVNARLTPHGLHVVRGRHGLAVTDGIARVPLSRVGTDTTPERIEKRFGQTFNDWVRARQRAELQLPVPRDRSTGTRHRLDVGVVPTKFAPEIRTVRTQLSRSARYLGTRIEQYDRRRRLEALVSRVGDDAHRVRAGRQLLQGRLDAVARVEERTRAGFGTVYRDAPAALEAFRTVAERSGVAHAAATLRAEPEHFGALRGSPAQDESRGTLGRLFSRDRGDPATLETARQAASGVARLTEEWAEVRRRLPQAGELERLTAWEARLVGREQVLRRQVVQLPPAAELERAIVRALPRVRGEELDRLAGTLRGEQRVILGTFREAQAEVARSDSAGELRRQIGIGRTPRAPGERPTPREREHYESVAASVAAMVLRQLSPAELRTAMLVIEGLRSPTAALQRAVVHALKQQLLGRDGPEH